MLFATFCCGHQGLSQSLDVYGPIRTVFEFEYNLVNKLQLDSSDAVVATFIRQAESNDGSFPLQIQNQLSEGTLEQFKLKRIFSYDGFGRMASLISKDAGGNVISQTFAYDSLPPQTRKPRKTRNDEVRNGLEALLPSASVPDSSKCFFDRKGRIVKAYEGETDYRAYKYGWRGRVKSIEEYGNGELVYYAKYAYHLNGMLKSEKEYGLTHGSTEGHDIYYNKLGLKTKDCRRVKNKRLESEETLFYEYNTNGQFTRQYYLENGVEIDVFRVEYDTFGREILFKYRDDSRRLKSYDCDGNLTEILYFKGNNLTNGTAYHYVR